MSNTRIFCIGAWAGFILVGVLSFFLGEPKTPYSGALFALSMGVGAVAVSGDRRP